MSTTTETLTLIHDHPLSDDGRTCVFFAQCPENSDLDIYRAVWDAAFDRFGEQALASRMAESYMAGRMRALSPGLR